MISEARILIVDDEAPIRQGCAKILAEEGAHVEIAEDGRVGLEKAKASAFDLALIDLKMPQMDGMELLRHLGELDPDLVKIVITGYATLETAIEAVQKGAYDYLPKPFTPNELRTRVRRGLERRFLLLEAKRLREERERNLLELATEKSRIQTIMQCMGDGVLVTNRNHQVVFCNLAARRLLNLRSPWQPGEPLSQMIDDPEFIHLVDEGMNLQGDQQIASRELLLQKPNPLVLMANCAPVRNEKGETLGAVTVLRDITELKELDKAKSRFVSMVAHELRAPLAAIEGYLDLILEGVTEIPPEKVRKILERTRERTQGLLAMVNDLLTLSRMQFQRRSREIERIHLPEVLQEVIEFMRGSALEAKIALHGQIPPDLPKIQGNREDLVRVFLNLVDNAIKYNRPGGSVTIQAQADENYVAVEIHDTGIGIPQNELPHIFDEFHRIKRKETQRIAGTGLGLSIAKKIVESYNGFIEVESQLNQGSKFRILFPRG